MNTAAVQRAKLGWVIRADPYMRDSQSGICRMRLNAYPMSKKRINNIYPAFVHSFSTRFFPSRDSSMRIYTKPVSISIQLVFRRFHKLLRTDRNDVGGKPNSLPTVFIFCYRSLFFPLIRKRFKPYYLAVSNRFSLRSKTKRKFNEFIGKKKQNKQPEKVTLRLS